MITSFQYDPKLGLDFEVGTGLGPALGVGLCFEETQHWRGERRCLNFLKNNGCLGGK